jgi:NADH:ubiquinone reductase (non-electrogenic)
MFSQSLIDYTQAKFSKPDLQLLLNSSVKEVKEKEILMLNKDKQLEVIPYGLLVWATGNAPRYINFILLKKTRHSKPNQKASSYRTKSKTRIGCF